MGEDPCLPTRVLVNVMYDSSLGLEDKGGIQSNLPLNRCLGGSGLFMKKMFDSKGPGESLKIRQ